MSTLAIVPKKKDPTECLICGKPLGLESIDSGFWTCHEHRTCCKCSHPLSAKDIQWSFSKAEDDGTEQKHADLMHARCATTNYTTLESDPTLTIKKSTLDYLNLARLIVEIDPLLSVETNQKNGDIAVTQWIHQLPDFEARSLFLRRMESMVAQASLVVRQDPKYTKNALKLREEKRQKQAQVEKETSTRPVAKVNKPNDFDEMLLAEFMKNFDIKSRKVAMKEQKLRDKALQALIDTHVPSLVAKEMVDKMLRDKISKGLVDITSIDKE